MLLFDGVFIAAIIPLPFSLAPQKTHNPPEKNVPLSQ